MVQILENPNQGEKSKQYNEHDVNGTSICTNEFEEQKIIVKRFIKIKT